jgi:hypothetical protein
LKPPKPKTKPDKVTIPFKATKEFKDALQAQAEAEDRTMSKLIRRSLQKAYPQLPKE